MWTKVPYFSEGCKKGIISEMRYVTVVALVFAVGCSGSSPTAPTPPVTASSPVVPPSYELNGTVVATNGGFRLFNLTIGFNNLASEQASVDGSFRVGFSTPSTYTVTVNGSNVVPRSVRISVTQNTTTTIDAVSLSGGFDLAFYRQFVRNGFEQPTVLQPIRRQLEAPRIYLRTIDDAGAAIDALTLNGTAAALESVAGLLTGRFGLAGIERGTDSRQGHRGWITVRWSAAPDAACGRASVGGDLITLYPKTIGCRCSGGPAVAPVIVKHELGHALGFWHTNNANDLMGNGHTVCDMQPSARERYHAAIAYARPVGNMDPDIDP